MKDGNGWIWRVMWLDKVLANLMSMWKMYEVEVDDLIHSMVCRMRGIMSGMMEIDMNSMIGM